MSISWARIITMLFIGTLSETQLPAPAQQAPSFALAPQKAGSHLHSVSFQQPQAAPAESQLSLAEPAERKLPCAEPAEARLPMAESVEGQLPLLAETAETGLRLAVQRCSGLVVQLSNFQSEVDC